VSIGSLFEGIAPINDGFYHSSFYKLFEEHQIFLPIPFTIFYLS
jgi:hypothetical protein